MLKNNYQEILVGLNIMSLVRGIISLRRNRSTLLIDDLRFSSEFYPSHFFSELEICALLRLGEKFSIPELQDLRQFLIPANIDFVGDQVRLKLGRRCLQNLQELLRKFPELIEASDLDQVYALKDEEFDEFFMDEVRRYEQQCFEMGQKPKGLRFELQGPKWFKTIFERFSKFLNEEYSDSKDLKYAGLLHLIGLSAEEKLKTRLGVEEFPFYFFRLLSPIYRLQDFFLSAQLKRRLLLLNGDFKESAVQYWQIHNHKFENLLLASFEGVISAERVLLFSHLPESVPFLLDSPYPFFRKTQMSPTKRLARPQPPTSISYIFNSEKLGSDRPYRIFARHEEMSFYHWPYPELPGSKAEFYDKAMLEDFERDSLRVPFMKVPATPKAMSSATLDLRQLRQHKKNPAPILERLPLEVVQNGEKIQGFEYWGPFRYRTLGLLALCYGVEGI